MTKTIYLQEVSLEFNFSKLAEMNSKIRLLLNLLLIPLACYSFFLIKEVPQPYGFISLFILAITLLFNLIKKRIITIPFYFLGLSGSLFVIFSAYSFISFTNQQREKFDIPTAVKFEQSDFESALIKAKKENKNLFIDFYTGWCAPCLSFTKNVLTDEEVGKFMNNTFINLKLSLIHI